MKSSEKGCGNSLWQAPVVIQMVVFFVDTWIGDESKRESEIKSMGGMNFHVVEVTNGSTLRSREVEIDGALPQGTRLLAFQPNSQSTWKDTIHSLGAGSSDRVKCAIIVTSTAGGDERIQCRAMRYQDLWDKHANRWRRCTQNFPLEFRIKVS
jgi:hypothetical protein